MVVASLFAGPPATPAPLDKGHFEDVFTDFFDCDGTPARQELDAEHLLVRRPLGGSLTWCSRWWRH